jgi:hypothetical protein
MQDCTNHREIAFNTQRQSVAIDSQSFNPSSQINPSNHHQHVFTLDTSYAKLKEPIIEDKIELI